MASYRPQQTSALPHLSSKTLPKPVFIVTDLDRDGRVEISGLATPGSTITLTLPGGQTTTAKAGFLGLFSVETTGVTANGSITGSPRPRAGRARRRPR